MARTRRAALSRQGIVRRMLVAVLACAMVMGQVPPAAFAEGLSADSLFTADALPGDAATDVSAGQAEVSEGREEGHDEAKTADAEVADAEASGAEGAEGAGAEAADAESSGSAKSDEPDAAGAGEVDAAGVDGQDAAGANDADAEPGAGHVDELVAAADANTVDISISVIGPDANGIDVQWAGNAKMELKAEAATADAAEANESAVDAAKLGAAPADETATGPTAADATEVLLKEAGLKADYGIGDYGFYLNTITSPYTGEKLGWDEATGKYWQLFVNGKASEVGASSVMLKTGDVITWTYSAYGSSVPEVSPVIPQPDAPRPDWDSAWPGYASGSNTAAPTPTGETKESWVAQIKDPADWTTNVSDPIYVGDCVYIAAGSKLLQIDAKTGETVREGALVAPINSIARMVYVGGRIIVPLSNGRLQALTADHLITMWMTPELLPNAQGGAHQSLTTLTLGDGCVYYGTASADWNASYGGFLRCIDVQTGKVIWSQENTTTGYYWSGAALAGSYVVIGDDSGAVIARNAKTGAEVSRVDVGARVRSTVVTSDGGKTLFAVSSDGVLHRLSLSDAGVLSETGKVKFAKSSTCTPTVSGGKIFVGGQSEAYTQVSKWVKAYYGVLAVIDAKTLAATQVSTLDGHEFVGNMNGQATSADIQSAPVVSVQNGETYVYFTANCNPGGVYRYRLGDTDASLIYTPDASHQNFCMASITVGPDGTLYYVNDSGSLFAVGSVRSEGGDQGGSEGGNTGGGQGGSGETDNGEVGGDQGGDGPLDGEEPDGSQGGTDDGLTGDASKGDGGSNSDRSPAGAPMVATKKALDDDSKDDEGGVRDEVSADGFTAANSKDGKDKAQLKAGGDSSGSSGAPLAVILPIAGVTVGVSGLGAIGYWLFRRRG